ncbi:MAG: transcription-repair coupling factor [Sphingomonadaceae bacterium]|nr:transcription-repair coupling factor [Sphingomonadaceae bacterium]
MTPVTRLFDAAGALRLTRVAPGYAPMLAGELARLAHARGKRLAWVTSDAAAMQAMVDAAQFFAPDIEVLTFPAWDCLPYDRSGPSLAAASARLATLARLQGTRHGPQILLTSANAVLQRTLTPFRIRALSLDINIGSRIARDTLVSRLSDLGYVRVDNVADHGEFAVRGGIVDFFPAGEALGYRLDFFGDEVEDIRRFDPADQRSSAKADGFSLRPASEVQLSEENIRRFRTQYRELFGVSATSDTLYQAISDARRSAGMEHWLPLMEERLVPLFDHLGDDCLWVEEDGAASARTHRWEAIADYHANRLEAEGRTPGAYRPLVPEALYILDDEWRALAGATPVHSVTSFAEPPAPNSIDLDSHAARDFADVRAQNGPIYAEIAAHIAAERRAGRKITLACYSSGSRARLLQLLEEHGARGLVPADDWADACSTSDANNSAALCLPLDHGFTLGDISILTEQDMLGDRLVRRAKKRKSADAFLAEMASLSTGDLIVHRDHGIGRYEGLISIPVGQSPHDCVWLTYAGGDKLFVPVENLDVLTRYGGDGEAVALDRLGGDAWQRRRAKMKERIREIAGVLLATAAQRALAVAPRADADASFPEFLNRFPYTETEDQEAAIADVLADLAAGKPMDRLVCGDVGFGKTEVALRAAFVAAMAGLQVAIVAPTTLLARQHHANFVERFRGFPINIGRLSRLVPAGEAKSVREALSAGQIDIVIGTHAVLAKAITFKRLGLIIVDEEQHFGVVHKERLKALRSDAHVLTLTATPIPRTLQMAMSGLRDLSVIKTPPVDRLAVRTYVSAWDAVVMREALLREHHRGGQSFIVVPRISDIPDIEDFLRKSVGEVRYVVAHGQMAPSEVEDRMSAFYEGRYDVLLSTTIVESGLDIPNANTLIIHRADRFGLSQLYQLRGRVGRSKTRAYAYFTTPADRNITETAEKRLKLLLDLDSLGAGFQLASHDLDMRGAGNLVGDEQSGHIREVGFELYQSMLEDAILLARAEGAGLAAPKERVSPLITLDAPILLPDDYVPDLSLRMALYRRLNDLESRAEIDDFAAEMIDRFGPLPIPTANLLSLMEIKLHAMQAGISRLDISAKGALVAFAGDAPPNVAGLIAYAERLSGTAKLRPDGRLSIARAWPSAAARLNGALQLSKGLAKLARQ